MDVMTTQQKDTRPPVCRRLSVAPMMEWTDRHCRMFHRQITGRALLYTEMLTANALLHGDPERWLKHDPAEYPLALQLGGSVPEDLARAVAIARAFGFCEINPSIGKGTTRKLTRLSLAKPTKRRELTLDGRNNCAPTMTMQFREILSCGGVWPREPKHQCFIQHRAVR